MRRQSPICGFDLRPVIRLRFAFIPQWWLACRADVRGLGVDPDVLKDLPDLRALGNERDQAHLPTALRPQQQEHFVYESSDLQIAPYPLPGRRGAVER